MGTHICGAILAVGLWGSAIVGDRAAPACHWKQQWRNSLSLYLRSGVRVMPKMMWGLSGLWRSIGGIVGIGN